MPQAQLPIFPEGTTLINGVLGVICRDRQVVYLNGHLPVFTHAQADLATFRFFTSQLIVNGTATQGEVVRAFGVPLVTVKRYVKKYRAQGVASFYQPPPLRQGPKLTPDVLRQAQALLDQELTVPEIARQTGVLANTLHKAVRTGRLKKPFKKALPGDGAVAGVPTTQSQRRQADATAPLGCATTRLADRLLAAVGILPEATPQFEWGVDVPKGGLLLALPALLANGLLRHSREKFALPPGFYALELFFLLLAFMALARVTSLEQLRYEPPGEWGKLLGLDRVPEVKTLREKLDILCADRQAVAQWSGQLAREWMATTPETQAGVFYADGHVRVYHGSLTTLPRRYVARDRLCLRGVTEYWVNAMDGQPFFVVTQTVDPGLVEVLRQTLIPRLRQDAPGQPTAAELKADPWRPRFTMVFDRQGYSPALFAESWAQRVAILSYHKFPGEDWPVAEFSARTVRLINGEVVQMMLAERGTLLSNGLWVREVRRLTESGHQTSVITTNFRGDAVQLAAHMFARWCQENFFKYMMEHYGLEQLIAYGTEPLPETTLVINPVWRGLDNQVRRTRTLLHRQAVEFTALTLSPAPQAEEVENWQKQKAQLQETLTQGQAQLEILKKERRDTTKRLQIKELPAEARFANLRTDRKPFVDTIKLIAYRAETALVHVVREKLARSDDARALIQQLCQSTADLIPDYQAQTLTISLHPLTSALQNEATRFLCEELNATETVFPQTQLRLVYKIGSS